jgi:anti-sigma regulatory factor (Ser/Thr protein kinase)
MEHSFARRIDSLDDIFEFLTQAGSSMGVPTALWFSVNLVVEELFTNMVKHDRDGSRDISLRINREGDFVKLSLTDFDVDDFDITQVPRLDTSAPLEERRPGGLGIHLVRRMTNDLSYHYENRQRTVSASLKLHD